MTDLNLGTKFCNNCEQDINAASFLMHEAFCKRNIIKCSICNKPYDKNLKDSHFDEFHSKVKCECGEMIELVFLDKHKGEECKKRQVICDYCKLSLNFDKIRDHTVVCGSRTELCTKCKKYILIKDLNKHLAMDCMVNNVKETPSYLRSYTKTPRPNSSLIIFPCEFCNKKFVGFQQLVTHQNECELNFYENNNYSNATFDNLRNSFENINLNQNVPDEFSNDELVPCEFCDDFIHFSHYETHISFDCKAKQKPSSPMSSSQNAPKNTLLKRTGLGANLPQSNTFSLGSSSISKSTLNIPKILNYNSTLNQINRPSGSNRNGLNQRVPSRDVNRRNSDKSPVRKPSTSRQFKK